MRNLLFVINQILTYEDFFRHCERNNLIALQIRRELLLPENKFAKSVKIIYSTTIGKKVTMSGVINKEKRDIPDRRKNPSPVISRYTFYGGRRKTARREEDKNRHLFVDLYSAGLLLYVLSVLCLSCLDAYLTLSLIEKGRVVEANPIMAGFLGYGIMHFTIVKFAITAAALIILTLFKNLRLTRLSLPFAMNLYIAVVIYELYLYML